MAITGYRFHGYLIGDKAVVGNHSHAVMKRLHSIAVEVTP